MKPATMSATSRSRRFAGLILIGSLLAGCAALPPSPHPSRESPLGTAEAFVDAFYSFDPQPLRAILSGAPASAGRILFYQGWAEGGNYAVVDRKPCRLAASDEVSCDITVRDDFIAALGTGYDVTDTFHLSFRDGRLVGARTSSNDPPEFELALSWLRSERPELLTGPCRGFFDGGPTPQACARAVAAGFADYRARGTR